MDARLSDAWAPRASHLARRVLREPFQPRSWRELGYFVASSVLAFVGALILAGFGISGLVLCVVLVGIVILEGGLRVARGLGRWQRTLAHGLLGVAIAAPEPYLRAPGRLAWLRTALGDRAAWRAVGYFVAKVPLTLVGIWFALSVWVEALVSFLSVLTGVTTSARFGAFGGLLRPAYPGAPVHGVAPRLAVLLTGVVFLLAAPWLTRFVVYVDRVLMSLLLGPDPALSRLRTLEESRARTVDAAAMRLRGIERDLHDGTQAQLVALAMRLGQAKDKLDRLSNATLVDADVDVIRQLVDEAHRGAKEAIADLRDLARGIHPPALDTGLDSALATLGARSAVPTEVAVAVPTRPPPAIEAIAYFCAAELLANVAQHSRATRASLSCTQHGPWLRIVVRDNGSGGATVHRDGTSSSGLAGLSDRVGAVDGHLTIASPRGGPTTVTIDIPLRSLG